MPVRGPASRPPQLPPRPTTTAAKPTTPAPTKPTANKPGTSETTKPTGGASTKPTGTEAQAASSGKPTAASTQAAQGKPSRLDSAMEKPTTNSAQVAQALSGSGGTSGKVHPSTVHGSFQHALAQAQAADKPPATAQAASTGKPPVTASTEKPPATAQAASTGKPPATAQAASTGKPSTLGNLNQLATSALNGLGHAANFADMAAHGSHLASSLMGSANHLASSLTGGGSTHATHGFEGTHQAPGYGHGGAVAHGATHAASHSHPTNLAHSASSAFESGHAMLGNTSMLAGLLQGGSGSLAKAAGRFAPGLNIAMAGMDAANAAKTFMNPNATLGQKLNSGITAMGSIAAATNIPGLSQAGATAATLSSMAAPLMEKFSGSVGGSSQGHSPRVGG